MSTLLKQKLKVIFTLAMLITAVVCFLLINGTFAWFASNKSVSATGFSATAKVSPNLIIAKTEEEITNETPKFSIDFNGTSRTNMIAVTHDSNSGDTYLKYLTNHYAVDFNTGNAKDEQIPLEFETVPSTNNEAYFIDHIVYLASAFVTLPVTSLTACISNPTTLETQYSYFNAASIDFYVDEVSNTGYRGTTSVSKTTNNDAEKYVNLFPSGTTIPLNTEGFIKIIMRCYFDGALQDPVTGNAYINSFLVRPNSLSLDVEFLAQE